MTDYYTNRDARLKRLDELEAQLDELIAKSDKTMTDEEHEANNAQIHILFKEIRLLMFADLRSSITCIFGGAMGTDVQPWAHITSLLMMCAAIALNLYAMIYDSEHVGIMLDASPALYISHYCLVIGLLVTACKRPKAEKGGDKP